MPPTVTPLVLPSLLPSASGRVLTSPFQFAMTGSENLLVVSYNSLVGVTLNIQGRVLDPDGTVKWVQYAHTPKTDRTSKTQLFPMGAGYLLNLIVFASSGTPRSGQTFVQLAIVTGLSGATVPVAVLLQGYVTSGQALAWPGSPIQSNLDGGGYQRAIFGTAPAVGAEFSEAAPTGARWKLLTVRSLLIASAAAGNRTPILRINASGVATIDSPQVVTVAPGGATFCSWFSESPYGAALVSSRPVSHIPPETYLLDTDNFLSFTIGRDVGDSYSAPIYTVLEWLEVK